MLNMQIQFELKNLNPQQLKAVEHTEGPLLVLAGAGSGKTRVITHRIAHLIYNQGVSPVNILAVTFTNKAAQEMKERISKLRGAKCRIENYDPSPITHHPLLKDRMDGLWIGTFHSVCLRLLRRHGQNIGYKNDFSVYDKSDQLGLVRDCIKELNINEDIYPAGAIARSISYLKGRLITPQEFSKNAHDFGKDAKVLSVYKLYQDKLVKNSAMDFDDLIMRSVELFQNEPEILSRYHEIFKYIMVDEYQDTNLSQYRLIKLLSGRHKNLCVVGDDDQSIYRFRGAELQNILGFENDYPSAMIIRLEQNYRSTSSILNIAGNVIEKNSGRREKRLWTENPEGEPVVYHRATDEREEANYVVRCIKTMIKGGRIPGHFAVLYRTNAQSRAIEEALQASAIPYILVGGVKFYERREVKDIISYIKVSLRPEDDISLKRIINVPHRGIGSTTLKSLEEYSRAQGISLYEGALKVSVADPPMPPFLKGSRRGLSVFTTLIEKLRILVRELSPSEFVKRIFEVTGYVEALNREDGAEDRVDNVMELFGAVKRYEERMTESGIKGFLDEISLMSTVDEIPVSNSKFPNHVSLMTLHSAKGLEFPVVFIAGFEEGTLPHGRALESEEELEEERRLCYVGITRAKERLYLTGAALRNIFGQSQSKRESRFLNEIKKDPKLMIEIDNRDMYNTERKYVRQKEDSSKQIAGSSEKKRFRIGARVRHSTWGVGIVESSEGNGEKEKVIVRFNSAGTKTLAVKFANLEVV